LLFQVYPKRQKLNGLLKSPPKNNYVVIGKYIIVARKKKRDLRWESSINITKKK